MFKVKDIMTKEVISVSPEMEIVKAAKILLENRINGMPVIDAFGRLVGIIAEKDLNQVLSDSEADGPEMALLLTALLREAGFQQQN